MAAIQIWEIGGDRILINLISALHDTVKGSRPEIFFGVSPFGIYRKGFPANVTVELDQYHDLYADPVAWLETDGSTIFLRSSTGVTKVPKVFQRSWSGGAARRSIPVRFPSIRASRSTD